MLPSKQELSNLLGSLYDAAADPVLWKLFLEQLARRSRATSAGLLIHDFKKATYSLSTSWRMSVESLQLYRDYYHAVDVWAQRGLAHPAGHVCHSQSLCALSEMRTKEIYGDFMVQFGIEHGMFGILENNKSCLASVSLYRDRSRSEFMESDLDVLQFLAPHLQRAFRLHFRLSELKSHRDGVEAALNMLTVGIVLVGTNAQIILMNTQVEELLNVRDGLQLIGGRLSANVRSESERLQAMIKSAAELINDGPLQVGGTLLVSRRRGHPLSVTVVPLRTSALLSSQPPTAVVFIYDPDHDNDLSVNLLRCFGLTVAEARLTMILLKGCSLKEAANSCGVTHNTAKSQLKTIFAKTNVRRQSELVRLLLKSSGLRNTVRA